LAEGEFTCAALLLTGIQRESGCRFRFQRNAHGLRGIQPRRSGPQDALYL